MEVVASLSPGRTASAQCGLFTHKSVPVIFDPPCNCNKMPARSIYFLHLDSIFALITRKPATRHLSIA